MAGVVWDRLRAAHGWRCIFGTGLRKVSAWLGSSLPWCLRAPSAEPRSEEAELGSGRREKLSHPQLIGSSLGDL